MDRNLPCVVFYWILVFYSVSTLTESRLTDSRSSGAANLQTRLRMLGEVLQPRLSAKNHQESIVEHGSHARPVLVKCHPDSMEVVVQADLFETGLTVDGSHLRLGADSPGQETECGAFQSGEGEFTILVGLTECGTKLSSTEEKIVYSNVLIHSPEPSPAGLFRLHEAAIPVECHYEKRYSVNGISLLPAWIPFVTITSEENQIDFDLRIMNDDWQHERGSHLFFFGDLIHFEVSVVMGNHIPLRVYVDHCVATATPDMDAELRYDFIEHHGCLADAYLTNSNSQFLPRVEENKLRFQLHAFQFYQEPSDQVFINCFVKAVPVTSAVSSQNRACSFIGNRWLSVDGSRHQVCKSCDVSQRFEEPPTTEPPKVTQAQPTVTSWASLIPNQAEHNSATYFHVRPGSSQFKRPQQPSKLRTRKADSQGEKTILLGPLTVLPSSNPKDLERKAVLSQETRDT